MKSQWRFAVAACLLIVTALLLQARGKSEVFPSREKLSQLPHHLGDWTGIDVAIPEDQLEILGAGDFLLRVYRTPDLAQPYVDLFIAYFPSQRSGESIHSPKNCLPGAGWSPVGAKRLQLSLPGHTPFEANQYVIAKGEDRMLVLYWYLAHDRAVASEYWAKFYLVSDSMRLNRSDGSLIRVTTPLRPGEGIPAAQQRLVSLAGNVMPLIDRYVPR